jgi:hypothetical protein
MPDQTKKPANEQSQTEDAESGQALPANRC